MLCFEITSLPLKKCGTSAYRAHRKVIKTMQEKKDREYDDFEKCQKTSVVCMMSVSRLERRGETAIIVICQDDLLGRDNSATMA